MTGPSRPLRLTPRARHQRRAWFATGLSVATFVLALILPVTALAQGLRVGFSSGGAGGSVVVPVTFSGDGVAHLQVDVGFDETVLSPVSVTAAEAFVDHQLDWSVVAPGVLRVVVWSPSCAASAESAALRRDAAGAALGDGILMNVSWEIAAAATPGSYPLTASAALLSTAEGTPVSVVLEDGEVEVVLAAAILEIPTLDEWGLIGLAILLLGAAVWVLRRGASAGVAATLVFLMVTQPLLGQVRLRGGDEAVATRSPADPVPRTAPALGDPGDADDDGSLTAADLVAVVDVVLERGTAAGDPDCNADGLVDVLDLACVVSSYCADGPPDNLPPALAPIAGASLRVGEVFAVQANASDPDPGDELTFSLLSAPVGMVVDPETGSVVWVPREAQVGTVTPRMRVTDQGGLSAERDFVVGVRAFGAPPVLQPIADQATVEGSAIAVTAVATDPDLPGDTLTFSLPLAPAGMTIDPASGQIAWTPGSPQVGDHDVTVQVADQEGLIDFTHFVASVRVVNRPPLARDDTYEARLGVPLAIAAPGVLGNDEDPDGDPLTAALVDDAAQGVLSLAADGGFDYLLEPPDRSTPVELELLCERRIADGSHTQTNGTVAVGDVDGDGDIELVGAGGFSGFTFITEFWILNAADCSVQFVGGASIEQAGGFQGEEQLGLLDIDGDGDLEIIGPRERYPIAEGGNFDDQHLHAFHHDGTLAWASETSPLIDDGGQTNWGAAGPTFADLDADGTPEIVMAFSRGFGFNTFSGAVAYDATDGSLEWEFLSTFRQGDHNAVKVPHVVDLDLDGRMEVIVHNSVLDHAGQLLFELPSRESVGTSAVPQLALAIANFDDDPFPELFGRDNRYHYLFEHDGTLAWQQELRNYARGYMTAADFDGDGAVEVAYLTCVSESDFGCSPSYLAVYDIGDDGSSLVWSHEDEPTLTIDSFYGTRSAVTAFDANRDGAFDLVLRHDVNETLYVIDGRDGSFLASAPAPDYSGHHRFVTVADVDLDGHAELVTSYTGGIEGSTAVWKGTAEHPLPAAPAHRSQWLFQEAHFKADGVLATNPVPPWLQPGRNGQYLITPEPDPLIGTTDSFTYVANGGALDSNVATVTLDILPPGNPPRFLSDPDTLTTRGFEYLYRPWVVDPDLGDTVTFRLSGGPAGMTIDPATGEVRWQPDALGIFDVAILALDTIGFAAAQAYELVVGDPVVVPDVVGDPEAAAESTLVAADLVVGRKTAAHHPTIPLGSVASQAPVGGSAAEFGGTVDLVLSLGPAPEDTDGDGDGFTPNQGDCDDAAGSIHPGAADPGGDGVDQDCDGFDGSEPVVEIVIEPASLVLLEGERRQLTAYALFADGTSQIATGIVAWGSLPVTTATVSPGGLLTAVADTGPAVVTATRGAVVGTADVTVTDHDPADDDAPEVAITSPGDGQAVFEPIDVIGVVDDPNLVRYELLISPADAETFTLFDGGTMTVAGGVLGQLDPTLLPNGLYTLRLVAFDAGGNSVADEVVVQVDGGYKAGRFTIGFVDLEVQLGGLPIQIERVYDSLLRFESGDFGFGWHYRVGSFEITCTDPIGESWRVLKSGLSFVLVPEEARRCSVRMPSGALDEFVLAPRPASSALVPFSFLVAAFQPLPGAHGTLRSLDNPNLLIADPQPGPVALLDDATLSPFAPERFLYTTREGLEITLSTADGVEQMRDRNGNTLTFGPGGITHSSGTGVTFQRDGAGRILSITGPDGVAQSYAYSASGDLLSHTDRGGFTTRFRHDRHHLLLDYDDPLGRKPLRNEYDEGGRLIATTDAEGNRIELDRDLGARREIVRDFNGQTIIEYDESGRIIARTNPLGERWEVEYDPLGNVVLQRDPLGRELTRVFDARGLVLEETDYEGNTRLREYDALGLVVREVDPEGNVTEQGYDARGNLTSRLSADGFESRFTYDGRGNRTTSIDHEGRTTRFAYDAQSRMVEEIDPTGVAHTFTYDANGNRLTESQPRTLPDGSQELVTHSYEYDANGQRIVAIDPLGHRTSTPFDGNGNEASVTDPLGHAMIYDYDDRNLVTEIEFSDGSRETFAHDAVGRLVARTDRDGRVRQYGYDALDRQIAIIEPGGATHGSTYDEAGRSESVTDPLGNVTRYEYGANLQRVEDPLGFVTEHVFDSTDAPVERIDAAGNSTVFVRDGEGRLVRTEFADATSETVVRSSTGKPLETIDRLGHSTRFEYDGRDRLIAVTDPNGATTHYAYDELDSLIAVTDALGRTTRVDRDALGRMVRRILPLGQVESFEYDAVGNLVRHVDFNGDATTLVYDADEELVLESFADGSEIQYESSDAGLRTRAGGATTTYDLAGRVSSVTDAAGQQLTYAYDAGGNITSVTSPHGVTTMSYDPLNRLSQVADSTGATIYGYDAVGNLARMEYPNGVVTELDFDDLHRLVEMRVSGSSGLLARYLYDLDAAGRRVRVEESGPATDERVVIYQYDAAGRLIAEIIDGPGAALDQSREYQLDAVGNRLRMIVQSADGELTVDYEYDDNDRLVRQTSSFEPVGGPVGSPVETLLSYDDNGALLSREQGGAADDFSWDHAGRLVAAVLRIGRPSPTSLSFEYDADGVRTAATVDGVTTRFLVDTNRELPVVLAESTDGQVTTFSHGHDPIAQTSAGGTQWYLFDGSMSVRHLTDGAGAVTDSYGYDAFGVDLGSNGATPNPFRYRGEQFDESLGMYYLRARYYHQDDGVFLAQDPAPGSPSDPRTFHRYLYAGADPVNNVDPTGMYSVAELGVITTLAVIIGFGFAYAATEDFAYSLAVGLGTGMLVLGLVVGPQYIAARAVSTATRASGQALKLFNRLIGFVDDGVAAGWSNPQIASRVQYALIASINKFGVRGACRVLSAMAPYTILGAGSAYTALGGGQTVQQIVSPHYQSIIAAAVSGALIAMGC